MTTLNEMALMNLTSQTEALGARYETLAKSLYVTQKQAYDKMEDLATRAAGDILQLTEVLDSFIRLVLDDGSATQQEKEGLVKHLNSFLSRNVND